jgi:hypothetical protein
MRATTRASKEQAEENQAYALSIVEAGRPAWIRTKNQQLMSPTAPSQDQSDSASPSENSGKVLQMRNPRNPRATSISPKFRLT